MNQPTPEELAAKVARFNEIVQPGQIIRYHELRARGPGRLFKTRGPSEIMQGHSAVVWLEGKSGCVQTDHCEVLPDQAAALEEFKRTRAEEFADLMVDEGPPRTATNPGGPLCQVDGCDKSATHVRTRIGSNERGHRLCEHHSMVKLSESVDGKLFQFPI